MSLLDYRQWEQLGGITIANSTSLIGGVRNLSQCQQSLTRAERIPVADGTKPVVICNGVWTEAKDMDDAQRKAESEAHSKSADAFILKPVKRISPKREVTTTELS